MSASRVLERRLNVSLCNAADFWLHVVGRAPRRPRRIIDHPQLRATGSTSGIRFAGGVVAKKILIDHCSFRNQIDAGLLFDAMPGEGTGDLVWRNCLFAGAAKAELLIAKDYDANKFHSLMSADKPVENNWSDRKIVMPVNGEPRRVGKWWLADFCDSVRGDCRDRGIVFGRQGWRVVQDGRHQSQIATVTLLPLVAMVADFPLRNRHNRQSHPSNSRPSSEQTGKTRNCVRDHFAVPGFAPTALWLGLSRPRRATEIHLGLAAAKRSGHHKSLQPSAGLSLILYRWRGVGSGWTMARTSRRIRLEVRPPETLRMLHRDTRRKRHETLREQLDKSHSRRTAQRSAQHVVPTRSGLS